MEQKESINLVSFKLEMINKTISEILERWKYNDTEGFLRDTESGNFDEGIMDAISMKQLLLDLDKYESILLKLKED